MKKNLKKLVMSLVLAVSVLASVVPAQAGELAPKVSKSGNYNKWSFKLYGTTVYEKQTSKVHLNNDFYGAPVTYKSSNTKVATVDKIGNVTGKKAGKVTITVTDGTHTSKCEVTVKSLKKAKKNEVVLNYADSAVLEYGKTYTIKNLNGSAVKSISRRNGIVEASGCKVKALRKTNSDKANVKIKLKNGKTVYASWSVSSSKEHQEAISIAKKGMQEYGVTKNSTDLEKAMFIYNWLGDHVDANGANKYGCEAPGHYYAIRKGYGDCDVYAEGACLLADVVELPVIRIFNAIGDHQFNGFRLDGKWYLVDTMQCESWEFALGNDPNFLSSYEHMTDHSGAMAFTVHPDAAEDVVFDSDKYDRASWPEYRDKFDAANADDPGLDPDFWND